MPCNKCKGQGSVKKITQLSGDETDIMGGVMAGIITMGLSLLVTTRIKDAVCDLCGGTGLSIAELINRLGR